MQRFMFVSSKGFAVYHGFAQRAGPRDAARLKALAVETILEGAAARRLWLAVDHVVHLDSPARRVRMSRAAPLRNVKVISRTNMFVDSAGVRS
jgi:hypothetical protein